VSDLKTYFEKVGRNQDNFRAYSLRYASLNFNATSPTNIIAAPGAGNRIVIGAIVLGANGIDQIRFREGSTEFLSLDTFAGTANIFQAPVPLAENQPLSAFSVNAGTNYLTVFYRLVAL
jgi:hypothetical protein